MARSSIESCRISQGTSAAGIPNEALQRARLRRAAELGRQGAATEVIVNPYARLLARLQFLWFSQQKGVGQQKGVVSRKGSSAERGRDPSAERGSAERGRQQRGVGTRFRRRPEVHASAARPTRPHHPNPAGRRLRPELSLSTLPQTGGASRSGHRVTRAPCRTPTPRDHHPAVTGTDPAPRERFPTRSAPLLKRYSNCLHANNLTQSPNPRVPCALPLFTGCLRFAIP